MNARVVTFQLQGAILSNYAVFTIEQIYEGINWSRTQDYVTEAEEKPPKDKDREGIQEIVLTLGVDNSKRWHPIFTHFLRGCSHGATSTCVMQSLDKILNQLFIPKGPYSIDINTHGNGTTNSSISYKIQVCHDAKKMLKILGKAVGKMIAFFVLVLMTLKHRSVLVEVDAWQ